MHQVQGILDCVIRELNEDYRIPTELRRFDFLAYPSWMRINQSRGYAGTGEYAWKVVLIRSILAERGFILWADAGCRYNLKGLMESMNYTRDLGFASRGTSGFIPTYVHPGQLKYLRYQVHYDRPRVKNCDGSVVGLTLDKYAELVKPWYDCSITRQCIAPDGSHHGNHRQDQAALTVISAMTGNPCQGISQVVKRHMDDHPLDYFGTYPSKCYADPLQVDRNFY